MQQDFHITTHVMLVAHIQAIMVICIWVHIELH